MKQKKLMLLGGIRYLLPVIDAAHKQGYYVITADYLPDNIAHRYSDEYVNVSIVDKEAVLKVACEKEIDGIMSFGVDPGVVAASYVQNKMSLPSFGPYESVPWSLAFSSLEDALSDLAIFSYPLIVKPTDSAGSKGVTRVDKEKNLKEALLHAFAHSIKNKIIVEQFIEKEGCSSDSDCFSINGELKFVSFSAQRFDEYAASTFVPAAYSWPSTITIQQESELSFELQRLLKLLNMNTSVYNIETRIGVDGKPYIMEVSPRGGGNRLSEMIRYATGVDLITAAVCASVGDTIGEIKQKTYQGYWAEIVLHAGRFMGLEISKSFSAEIVEEDLWVEVGDEVESFEGANNAIGMLILKFDSLKELEHALATQRQWLKVNVR